MLKDESSGDDAKKDFVSHFGRKYNNKFFNLLLCAEKYFCYNIIGNQSF